MLNREAFILRPPPPAPRPLRVLYVHSGNLYGGVETLLRTLWRERAACPSMGPEFALCFEGRLRRELEADGATVHALGGARVSRPLSVWRARRALGALLRRERFDAVVCHSAWAQGIFAPVVRDARLPLVFWLHDSVTGAHWLERWARRTPPDLLVCNSRFTAESARRLYPRARAEVVYCPVSEPDDAERLTPAGRAALRAELDTPDTAVVIIQVGRMESLKGHAVHLEALALLRDVPGWVCWQIGGAQRESEIEYVDGLKRLAVRLGIGGRVRFAGERADVPRLLSAADVYCQPNTRPESFGLTFAEAMLARLPVVTTDIGGAREIVDASCGLLVPPGDAHALAGGLRKLIESPSLRDELGRHSRQRARDFCDPATQFRTLGGLFGGLTHV
jgi:glycosyltransferase involved in cell wall biosynthesis